MKIKMPEIKNEMGSTVAALNKERQLLRKADSIFVSSFKLRLSPNPQVQKYELEVLLKTARSNPRYQSNAANYQFKLKSDSQGQYITLKQQGWWSSFKGMFGWGREAREKQRTDAMDLINLKLGRYIGPTGTDGDYLDLRQNDRLNFANAKSYQTNVFESMGLGPSAQGANSETTNSEAENWEDLMGESPGSSAYIKEDARATLRSQEHIVERDPSGEPPAQQTQFVMPTAVDGGAPRNNSLFEEPLLGSDPFEQQPVGSPESPSEQIGKDSHGSGVNLFQKFITDQLVADKLFDAPYGSDIYN